MKTTAARGILATGADPSTDRKTAMDLVAVLLVALAVRLSGLPYAGHDSFDHALRVWIAWRWIDDPFWLTYGVWGPLHFFLIGPIIALTGDPLRAPVFLHIVLGAMIPPVVYTFTRREFRTREGALVAALVFALYPVAILNSLSVRSETPFALLVALAMLALSYARRSGGLGWAASAGLALTAAGALRYEGWMLVPLLAGALWPRLAAIAVFIASSSIFPLVSMASNYVHYGDPIWGITWAARNELVVMGKASFSLSERLLQLIRFAVGLIGGMTPVAALFAGLGVVGCVLGNRREAIWLLPLIGLSVLLFAAAVRGSLVPKVNYTETLGLLLIPFVASFVTADWFGQRRILRPAAYGLLFGSMACLLILGALRDLPGMRERSAVVAAIPAMSPIPGSYARVRLEPFAAAIRAELDTDRDGFISDSVGYSETGFIALQTGMHPDHIFLAPPTPRASPQSIMVARSRDLRTRPVPLVGNRTGGLAEFLRLHPTGVILLQPGSRFAGWLNYSRNGGVTHAGLSLSLAEIARIAWPLPSEASRLAPGANPGDPGKIIAFRYSIEELGASSGQPIRPAAAKRK